MKTRDISDSILKQNNEDNVRERIDEAIPEYLSDGWEDEFADIHEAYTETGRGEAESLVLTEIIEAYCEDNATPITADQHCDIFDDLKNTWGLVCD